MDAIIQTALQQLFKSQTPQGVWIDCFDTGAMPNAQTSIALYLLGVSDTDWTNLLLRQILATQRSDGAWSIYPTGQGDLSTTVECYYALQLYGYWDGYDDRQRLAEAFIRQSGGLKKCRNLTKVFLALGGEISWSWLPSPKIYLLLFSKWFPVGIWDIVTFTRLHVAPMLLLSSLKFVSDKPKNSVLTNLMVKSQHYTEKHDVSKQLSPKAHRRLYRCLKWVLERRESDGTVAGYHSSTLLVIFALRAFGYGVDHPDIQNMIHALRRALYLEQETGYCHQQTCDAHIWNTALAVNAISATGVRLQTKAVERAIQYLASKQQRNVGEWFLKNPRQPGGWAFSSNNTIHPDIDDTVACLEALYPYREQFEKSWWIGVNWLLGMQNNDGGWSAFDKNCNRRWLEWIPANDMKRTMCDPSTPDITGRVVEFLIRNHVLPLDDRKIVRALRWIHKHQESDGSWFGRWGTTYIYGTWCAVKALVAAEVASSDHSLSRAKEWLFTIQHLDGSFGESCQSDIQGRFVPVSFGLPSQTAWGLDSLLYLFECEEMAREKEKIWLACEKAVGWLLAHFNGQTWTEDLPTGSAFPGALHIRYHIYPKVWPLIALSHYRSLALTKGGE
ncbi:hypothetical protein AN477_01820 [Alicyclobacillus ferrooxydans]|uniref:Squalene-hopene cyclase n=1 Tax=Alicyclobacillus ferrooxydans TaxID=471514 RepID=A0A0P9D8K5_9BACL|nr:hypothetical protein AN477_01820 [Alicyclobacillus ferrooxydans]